MTTSTASLATSPSLSSEISEGAVTYRRPSSGRRVLTAMLLAAGPALTAAFALAHRHSAHLGLPGMLAAVLFVGVVVAWCPALLFSIPALVLGDARDITLPWSVRGARGLLRSVVRGVILVPYMCCSRHSPARLETVAAVAGWLFGLAMVLPYLHAGALGL